ncbi:hypothetical protein [Nitrospina gracilis]|uniref:hypothetical protein n=1 Tax=Nitrospina gracilis TaxID=35801 RepID=UPI001F36C594|nr:hypothetical protein [Nitrospina gracilis]MCF8720844.1 ABC-type phosphate transport system auxiliary subunit [Nitrospina gracilis Nb-211]
MLMFEGEITQTKVPPNKAEFEREVVIWIDETSNELEITLDLNTFQKNGFQVGDKLTIKIEKQADFDSLARDFFKENQ